MHLKGMEKWKLHNAPHFFFSLAQDFGKTNSRADSALI